MIIFQKNGSQVLKKDFADCKTGKKLEKDLHLREIEKRFNIIYMLITSTLRAEIVASTFLYYTV